MPVYTIRGPDGRTYEVKGPSGATAEQLGAFLTENLSNRQVKEAAQLQADKEMANPANSGTDFGNFRAGFGKAIADLVRGVGQNVGLVSRQDVKESRQLDAPLMGTKAGIGGNFAGNATLMAPLAAAPAANTILGAAAYGAGMGYMQPSASTEETLKNVSLGAISSAVVPAAITGFKTAKSLVEPLYQGGRDAIVGRTIADASAVDPATLAATLRSNQSAVPGVQRTVAEVADNPSLAALQRTASQTNPAVMNEAAMRAAANNEARIAALRSIAGDKTLAVKAREAATEALYNAANGKKIQLTPELEALMARPQMKTAISSAQTLAANEGRPFSLKPGTPDTPSSILGADGKPMGVTPGAPGSLMTEDAHTIKRALDDTVEALAGQGGLGKNARRAALGTKEEFLQQIEQQVPEYGQARQTFAQLSAPVNQAEVADAVVDRALKSNVQGNLTPAAFNRALSDRTAQSALGRKIASLEGTFTPEQMSIFNAVKDDLQRADFAANAGKGGGSDTVQKLAYSNLLSQAGVPSFVRNLGPAGIVGNLAQRAGQVVYKDANEKLAEQLARALMNPNEAADLVTGAMVTPQMQALIQNLRRGGTALGASAPGLVQANQQ